MNASDGQFEEHPESYRPRVFVAVTKVVGEDGDGLPEYSPEVYELLTDGQAISWDCLPQKECCGFDFWTVYADSIHDITMTRAPRVLPTEVNVQGKTFPLFIFPKDLMDCITRITDTTPVPQADGDSGDETCPATTMGAGYCTCNNPLLNAPSIAEEVWKTLQEAHDSAERESACPNPDVCGCKGRLGKPTSATPARPLPEGSY